MYALKNYIKQNKMGLPWWSSGKDPQAPNAEDLGSTPGQETRSHVPQLRVHMPPDGVK